MQAQAESFLSKIEEQSGKDALEKFYETSRPHRINSATAGMTPIQSSRKRRGDTARVVPPAGPTSGRQKFLESMKKQGLSPEVLKQGPTS